MSSLHQDVYWTNREGEVVNLDDMGARWRRNVMWFLRDRCVIILHNKRVIEWNRNLWIGGGYDFDGGDVFGPPVRPTREEAMEWLESTPFMQRLHHLVADDLVRRS